MNVLETKDAPGAIGPYSQGMEAGSLVFTSGQIPVDPGKDLISSILSFMYESISSILSSSEK